MVTKHANLTDNQRDEIEQLALASGDMILGDDLPPKTVMSDKVKCPICGDDIQIYSSGNSYVISCLIDGVIVGFRGFSNPSYLWKEL